jgi:hypothetical protein
MKRLIPVASTAAVLVVRPAHAVTIPFSFTDTVANLTGLVTGELVGLADNFRRQCKSSLKVH